MPMLMQRLLCSVSFFLLILFPLTGKSKLLEINFYSQPLQLQYDAAMLPSALRTVDEPNLQRFYTQLDQRNYQPLLESLLQLKQQYQLNDWFTYELMREVSSKLYRNYARNEQELLCWFLLSKMGFDTRIAFRNQKVYLYIYTLDDIYETPMIQEADRMYVNLSKVRQTDGDFNRGVYMLSFIARPDGQPFSFHLKKLPTLKPDLKEQEYTFSWRGDQINLRLPSDRTIVRLMEKYPLISESAYLKVPFSASLHTTVIPQFKKILADKSTRQAVEILVAFTRSAFAYKEDKEYFGYSKPMIPDEVLHYPFSDCEDRSALFYMLVKELLDLPMLIIGYPDHLTIAVALEDIEGDVIRFNNKHYFICDPTGPANSAVIGIIPDELKGQTFEILDTYK